MKVLISKEALKRHSLSIPAHAGYSQFTMDWRQVVSEYLGKWVTVETDNLFEDQFNIKEGNLRINATLLDDIDFEEIGSFENYKALVTERYAKDWPGSKLKFWHIRQVLHRANKGECPSRELDKVRGYDNWGNAVSNS